MRFSRRGFLLGLVGTAIFPIVSWLRGPVAREVRVEKVGTFSAPFLRERLRPGQPLAILRRERSVVTDLEGRVLGFLDAAELRPLERSRRDVRVAVARIGSDRRGGTELIVRISA